MDYVSALIETTHEKTKAAVVTTTEFTHNTRKAMPTRPHKDRVMLPRLTRWFGRNTPVYRLQRPPRLSPLEERVTLDATPHNLLVSNFYQNWNNGSLITANDNWSGVLSIVGYLGDDTFSEGVNPQTVLTPYSTVDVIANQGVNTSLTAGGVAEFDGFQFRTAALQSDGTADAPNLVISINTTGRANIAISYNLRDIDGTADNAVQPVALQYRIGNAGSFVNVPAGFVADATTGPSLATKVTPVSVALPSAVDNQSLVQFRVITTNAVGNDEWVGVDDIVIGSKEFAINTFTANFQGEPSVAVDADGDALIAWMSYGQDGSGFSGFGIFGQRFDSAGAKVGVEFQISTQTMGSQNRPSVAVDVDGDAVVVWVSDDQDGSGDGIYGQRFNSAGAKVGTEFQVNTYTTNDQFNSSVAVDADGDAVVVWESFGQDGSFYGVYGQRFNSTGNKVGGEFQINTYTTSYQNRPSVAVDADGDAMVTWDSWQDGDGWGVYGQRYDSAGVKVGSEIQINTYTTSNQGYASVALDADGDAVVVWGGAQVGPDSGIYGQRFNSAGAKVGGEFKINTYTPNEQVRASVAIDPDGDALITWMSYGQENSGYAYYYPYSPGFGIYAQRFNSAGAKVGGEFQINTYTTFFQVYPSVAMDVDGDVLIVWNSFEQDGSGDGVYGQRFCAPPARVSNVQVNNGSAQRAMVTSLMIAFDSPVSFVGSPTAAFSLVNQKTTNAATLSAAVDLSGTFVTLTFTGGSVDLGGSLSDGRYTLNIIGNQFTGNGFDGNGDGISGDNYVLMGSPANGLFRLFGDADGDGSVAANDFIQFRLVLGGTSVAFDFDNDGAVAASDFIQFRLRFGGSI